MPLRETRRFKTKSTVVAFGDLMLPLVGLVAVALLITTAKIFFFSGSQYEAQPVPVVAPPFAPKRAGPQVQPVVPVQQNIPQRAARGVNLVMDLPRDLNKSDASSAAKSEDAAPKIGPEAGAEEVREEIIIKPTLPPATDVVRVQPVQPVQPPSVSTGQPVPRPALRARQTAQANSQPQQTQQAQQTQQTQQKSAAEPAAWTIQVGAYSTKAIAETAVKNLANAGYTATIASGKTFHRVLVQSGATRQDARNMAAVLDRAGYKGAFVIAPN